MKSDEKKRMSYDKPAVVFEKNLEALAADCSAAGYLGGTDFCKGDGSCDVSYS